MCGCEVFAGVVWRVCAGLHRILDCWLRCVTSASPACCVFGYPAWFTDMSRGGVRQTTVDGLPRVIKFGREAFVDVVWKGCLRGCIVSGTLGCGAYPERVPLVVCTGVRGSQICPVAEFAGPRLTVYRCNQFIASLVLAWWCRGGVGYPSCMLHLL